MIVLGTFKGTQRPQDVWDFSWDALRCISTLQIRNDLGSWVSRSCADLHHSIIPSHRARLMNIPYVPVSVLISLVYSSSHLIFKAVPKGRCCHPQCRMKPQRLKTQCPAQGHRAHSLRIWLQNKSLHPCHSQDAASLSLLLFSTWHVLEDAHRWLIRTHRREERGMSKKGSVAGSGRPPPRMSPVLWGARLRSSLWPSQRCCQPLRNLQQTKENWETNSFRIASDTVRDSSRDPVSLLSFLS